MLGTCFLNAYVACFAVFIPFVFFLFQLQSCEACAITYASSEKARNFPSQSDSSEIDKIPCDVVGSNCRDHDATPFSSCTCMNSVGAITFATPSHGSPVLHHTTGQVPFSLPLSHPLPHFPACFSEIRPFFLTQDFSLPSYSPLPLSCAQFSGAGFSPRYPPPVFPWSPFDKSSEPPQLPLRAPISHSSVGPRDQHSERSSYHSMMPSPHSGAPLRPQQKIDSSLSYFRAFSPCFFSQYNPYPYCANPVLSTGIHSLSRICCINATPPPVQTEISAECTPVTYPSSPSRSGFASSNESGSFTPPRTSCSMKRTSSYLNLSLSTPSPSSPASSPGTRTLIHPHRSVRNKSKLQSRYKASSPSPSHNLSDSQIQTAPTHGLTFSKINKPPALVLARQRLPSREIPDVLTPNTPKFVSPSGHLHLTLK